MLRLPDTNDELDRPLDLEGGIDLLAPRFLFERVRHCVVRDPQVGGPQEGTLVDGPGLK